jgi:hypothetical protein
MNSRVAADQQGQQFSQVAPCITALVPREQLAGGGLQGCGVHIGEDVVVFLLRVRVDE